MTHALAFLVGALLGWRAHTPSVRPPVWREGDEIDHDGWGLGV